MLAANHPPFGFGWAISGLELTQYVTPMSVQHLEKIQLFPKPKPKPFLGFGFAVGGLALTRYVTPMETQNLKQD